MDSPPTRAEETALSVFHDLQLAHRRKKQGAPKRAARLRTSAKANVLEDREDAVLRFQEVGTVAAGSR